MAIDRLKAEDVRSGRLLTYLVSDQGSATGIAYVFLVPRYDHTRSLVGYQAWYRRQFELFVSEDEAEHEAHRTLRAMMADRGNEPFPDYWRRVNAIYDPDHPRRIWPGAHDYLIR